MLPVPASARSRLATGRILLSSTPIIGAVLVGGASRRFGEDKASVIGPRVLAAMREAGIDPIVAVGGTAGVLPIPTIADRYPGEGPLAAVATVLTYARSGRVLVATCDLALLDGDTVRSLVDHPASADPNTAVVASADGVLHPSLGCWPASWAQRAHRAVGAGERRFRHLLDLGPIEAIEVDPQALEDADDRPTLRALLASDGSRVDDDMTDASSPEA